MWVILCCTPVSELILLTLDLFLVSSSYYPDLRVAWEKLLAVSPLVLNTRELPLTLSPLAQPYQCGGDKEKWNLVERYVGLGVNHLQPSPISQMKGLWTRKRKPSVCFPPGWYCCLP